MALLQLPVLQASGGAVFEVSNNNRSNSTSTSSTSFLSSASSYVSVGCDHSRFPYSVGGGCRQSSCSPLSPFGRSSQGDELISYHRRFSGHGTTARSDSQLSSDSRSSRQDGYCASSGSDSSRRNEFSSEISSGRDGQDQNYRKFDFNRDVSSGDGRQDDYASAPRPDSWRKQGSNRFSSQQRSSGGAGGGRENAYAASSSRRSDPRRIHQGSNSYFQRDSDDGYNDLDSTTRSYSRNGGGDNFNFFQMGRQGGNDGERSAASRDGPRVWDDRTGGQGRSGKVSGRNSSSKPSPLTQTFTPRQSTAEFVSDRTIYRAPWEQGPRSSSSSSWRGTRESDVPERNPFIERLKRMQEKVENNASEDDFEDEENSSSSSTSWRGPSESDVAEKNPFIKRLQRMQEEVENDDSVDHANFDGLGSDSNRGYRDFDDEAGYNGSRQNSAMARIVERLSKIPGSRSIYRSTGGVAVGLSDETSVGPKYGQPMFPGVGRGWTTPDNPIPTPAPPSSERVRRNTTFAWEREDARPQAQAAETLTRVKTPWLADLTITEDELKRLRSLGILTKHRIRVGKLGVTNGIVESIHNEWCNSEVCRVKCEGPPLQNMKRTHEILEERTGGLVVWRAGGACLVYRGKDYVPPRLKGLLNFSEQSVSSSVTESQESKASSEAGLEEDSETEDLEEGVKEQTVKPKIIVPRVSSVYDPELEREMEDILSTLGPRYDDWTGSKPVPVDADLLVGPNFTFKKPFRHFPYGVKPKLSDLELTNLRRLGRPSPPHFVLGVNRGLEGLAASIVKLWEKSEIAKIAVKRGIQNTNHERMAEQLKRLTGGVLLSRDKYFIVLYRGKDFLPPAVAAALEERQTMTSALQDEEEKARLLPQSREVSDTSVERSIAGTLAETLEAKANWERLPSSEEQRKIEGEVRRCKRRDISRRIQRKVAITMAKKHKAELELQKVEKSLRPAGPPLDRENITDEERHMFGKLGLKMHAFLLLGRRGVFGGTVENMHLHWKHRPLVKVIYKARDRLDLEQTARMLEYESGGILVATVPTNKGQAIIVYRGKNYQRPPELRPRTLLTKRQALKRSIEMQRQQSLTKNLLALEKEIENMKADLSKLGDEDGEDDDEGDEENHEPTANDREELQEEAKDLTTSEVESPKEDGEGIEDSNLGRSTKRQNLDLIYRADPLSRRERLILRQQALKEKKRAAHFNVGQSNVLAGLARAIRIHFRKHALVKVGVRGRAKGTPVEEILYQLQEATGGTLVSHEHSKVILYRGWPEGHEKPTEEIGRWEKLPPHLRSAMIAEVEADHDYLHESDWEEPNHEDDDEDEADIEIEYFEGRATMGDAEGDDDSDWDEFEEDENEGYLENELDRLPEEEVDHEDDDKAEEEHVTIEVAVNDAV